MEKSIENLSMLKAKTKVEKLGMTPKQSKEISIRSEDPLYELAQLIPNMDDLDYTSFVTQFVNVCDCSLWDNRAMSILMCELKKRSLADLPTRALTETLRLLQVSREYDRCYLNTITPQLLKRLPEFPFICALALWEYAIACTGYENYELFCSILSRLKETLSLASTSHLHRVYSVIHVTGIRDDELLRQLNEKARVDFHLISVEGCVLILDALLSVAYEGEVKMPQKIPPATEKTEKQPVSHTEAPVFDIPLVTRLVDRISEHYSEASLNVQLRHMLRLVWCLQQPPLIELPSRISLTLGIGRSLLHALLFKKEHRAASTTAINAVGALVWGARKEMP